MLRVEALGSPVREIRTQGFWGERYKGTKASLYKPKIRQAWLQKIAEDGSTTQHPRVLRLSYHRGKGDRPSESCPRYSHV